MAPAGLTVLALAAGALFYFRWPGRADCAAAATAGQLGSTVIATCRAEYERTRRPATGAQLAEALLRGGDGTGGRALVIELLATAARPEALYLLGQIAFTEGRLDDAVEAWRESHKLHREGGRRAELARDAMALAGVYTSRHEFIEAMYSLDGCFVEAQAASATVQGRCHIAAARVLIQVGQLGQARQELSR